MSCSCRAVSWRTFVRGLAQVHRLEPSSSSSSASRSHPGILQGGSLVPRSINRPWAAARESRGLHTSKCWSQDAGVRESHDSKPVAERTGAPNGGENTSPAASPPSVEANIETREAMKGPRTDVEKKNKKLKPRWRDMAEPPVRSEKGRKEPPRSRSQNRSYKPETNQQRAFKWKARDGVQIGEKSSPEAKPKQRETWQVQKAALKAKFPEGWNPRKRLSPDALAGIRALHAEFPEAYTTSSLAAKFQVSPEAIRRILRTKWSPSAPEEQERGDRWFRRGMRVWEQKAALGVKPPKMWRMEGVARDPSYHEWSKRASEREREWEEEEIRKYREDRERKKRQQQQRQQQEQKQEHGDGGPTRG